MRSKFSVTLGHNIPWPEIVENAQAAEDAGFDCLWLPDHLANPFAETRWLEAWTSLAGLAAVTSRIRIGSLVTSPVYRHPAVLAKQAITVDCISQGRVEIGLGAGGNPGCHTMTGSPVWTGSERQERFEEYVALLDQILSNEKTDYRGKYYSSEGTVMNPRSVQLPRPRFTIAAHGPRSLDVAARFADTWNFIDVSPGLTGQAAADAVASVNEVLTEKAKAVGRDPDSIRRSMTCGFAPLSSWATIEEAAEGVKLFEEAGLDEFIFTYGPGKSPEARREQQKVIDAGVAVLLGGEEDLRALATALDLS